MGILLLFFLGSTMMSFLMQLADIRHLSIQQLFSRSCCRACEQQLALYDTIPLLSFIVLKGYCRHCHSPIPKDLFIAEIIGGCIVILPIYATLFLNTTLFYTISFLLLVVTFQDIRCLIVPHRFLFLLFTCSLFLTGLSSFTLKQFVLMAVLLVCSLCLHRYIGMGDFKLLMTLSIMLPPSFLLFIIWLTFPIGLMLFPMFYYCRFFSPPHYPLVPAIYLSFNVVAFFYPTLLALLGGII